MAPSSKSTLRPPVAGREPSGQRGPHSALENGARGAAQQASDAEEEALHAKAQREHARRVAWHAARYCSGSAVAPRCINVCSCVRCPWGWCSCGGTLCCRQQSHRDEHVVERRFSLLVMSRSWSRHSRWRVRGRARVRSRARVWVVLACVLDCCGGRVLCTLTPLARSHV